MLNMLCLLLCSHELEKEDTVASIILRVYNTKPDVFIKINLSDFIKRLAEELEIEG